VQVNRLDHQSSGAAMSKTPNAIDQLMDNATFKADGENEHEFGLGYADSSKSLLENFEIHREEARLHVFDHALSYYPFSGGEDKYLEDTMQGYNTRLGMRDRLQLSYQTRPAFNYPSDATNTYSSVSLSLPADNAAALDKWLTNSHHGLFCITGIGGAGKSILMRSIAHNIEVPEVTYIWTDTLSCRRYIVNNPRLLGSGDTTGSLGFQRLQVLLERLQRPARGLLSSEGQGKSNSPVTWTCPTKIMEERSDVLDNLYGTSTGGLVAIMFDRLMMARAQHVASHLGTFCRENRAWNPLQCAASASHLDTVRLLLKSGADVSAESDITGTPHGRARFSKQLEAVHRRTDYSRRLISGGATSPERLQKMLDIPNDTASMVHRTARQYLSAREEHEAWPDEKASHQHNGFFWRKERPGAVLAPVEDHNMVHNTVNSRSPLHAAHIFAKAGTMFLSLASMHIMRNYAESQGLGLPESVWIWNCIDGSDKVCAFEKIASCRCSLTISRTYSRNQIGLRNPVRSCY
jgi:hypothetical protein